jgi:hypothetical protein
MATVAEIITSLKDAVNTGVDKPLTVTYGGRTITYRSLVEITQALAYFEKQKTGDVRTHFKISNFKAGDAK